MTTLEKLEELVYHGFEQTDRSLREVAEQQKETDRKVREVTGHLNGLTDSLGLFAENMVFSGATKLFLQRGIVLDVVATRVRGRRNGEVAEFDIIGNGPHAVVAIEVKLRLRRWEIDRTVEKLGQFFEFFPRFQGLTLYGAIAGMSMPEELARAAAKHGLFVIALSEENIRLWNDDHFVPRIFGKSGNGELRAPKRKSKK